MELSQPHFSHAGFNLNNSQICLKWVLDAAYKILIFLKILIHFRKVHSFWKNVKYIEMVEITIIRF
jgi:hypothetical protein